MCAEKLCASNEGRTWGARWAPWFEVWAWGSPVPHLGQGVPQWHVPRGQAHSATSAAAVRKRASPNWPYRTRLGTDCPSGHSARDYRQFYVKLAIPYDTVVAPRETVGSST